MKLGILVVYLAEERDEGLLDLHLNKIEDNTNVPYKIYGSTHRLFPRFEKKLRHHPSVKICDCPQPKSNLTGSKELAFYLESLIDVAIDEGVTHISTLHVDSFPIKSGWAEELAINLSDNCPLTGIIRHEQIDRKPMTACMFFHRDFYLKYNPTFLLPPKILMSKTFNQYIEEVRIANPSECGVGYGYKIYLENLEWKPLCRSSKMETHPFFGGVYEDTIFHLGAANFPSRGFPGAHEIKLRKAFSYLLPQELKGFLRNIFPLEFLFSDLRKHTQNYENVRKQLLKNPESFLRRLRSGKN